jgi:hypothetical protein
MIWAFFQGGKGTKAGKEKRRNCFTVLCYIFYLAGVYNNCQDFSRIRQEIALFTKLEVSFESSS